MAVEGDAVQRRVIRVLHVIVSLEQGGAEQSLLELVSSPAPDIEQSVVAIRSGGSLTPDFEAKLPGSIHSLGVRRGSDLGALARLVTLVRRSQPTLLHTWMFHANVLGRLAGAITRRPVICGIRSLELWKPRWRIVMDRATTRLAAHTVAVSQAALDVAVRRDHLDRDRASVIPNGERLPDTVASLQGLSDGNPVLGSVGRLEAVKAHMDLVDAFAQVLVKFPRASLEIVGDGSLREALNDRARSRGIAERVRLPGQVLHARALMSGWDIYVQPSLAEGMPRAMLEAMAAGLPVVATQVGGIPEALGEAGILVPPAEPDRLAAAILQLASDPELARAKGESGRQRVSSEFSHSAFVQKHFDLYRRVASGSHIELSE